MLLYHGSTMTVKNPKLIEQARALDFGAGFYVTTNKQQAERWANTTTKRKLNGSPTISLYTVDESQFQSLSLLTFLEPNVEWLKFISLNRKGLQQTNTYDIIIGPVANDFTMPTINLYLKGSYDEQEALKRLMPQKLKDQYTFKALELLIFCEEIHV